MSSHRVIEDEEGEVKRLQEIKTRPVAYDTALRITMTWVVRSFINNIYIYGITPIGNSNKCAQSDKSESNNGWSFVYNQIITLVKSHTGQQMPIKKKLSSSHDVQKFFYRWFWSKNFPTPVSTVWRTLIESPGSPPTGLQGDTSCQKSKLAQLLQAGVFSGLLVFFQNNSLSEHLSSRVPVWTETLCSHNDRHSPSVNVILDDTKPQTHSSTELFLPAVFFYFFKY